MIESSKTPAGKYRLLRLLFLFSLVVTGGGISFGQSVIVVDSLTNFPLPGAVLQTTSARYVANDSGRIDLDTKIIFDKPAMISMQGYKSKTFSLKKNRPSDTVYLAPANETLRPVTVSIKSKRYKYSTKHRTGGRMLLSKYDLGLVLHIKDAKVYGKHMDSIRIYLSKEYFDMKTMTERKINDTKTFLALDIYQADASGRLSHIWHGTKTVTFGKDEYMTIIPDKRIKITSDPILIIIHDASKAEGGKVYFHWVGAKKSKKLDAIILMSKKDSLAQMRDTLHWLIGTKYKGDKTTKYLRYAVDVFMH